MTATQRLLLNIAGFQLGWFACILGAAAGRPGLGVLVAAGVIALHAWITGRARVELVLAAALAVVGAVWETVAQHTGLLTYASSGGFFAPAWIIAMWPLFATTLNGSLSFLKGRTWLQALFGALGGPLAYYGGLKLGAVEMDEPVAALLLQGFGWAVLLPFACWLAGRLAGAGVPQRV
jgi:hypothetical protein